MTKEIKNPVWELLKRKRLQQQKQNNSFNPTNGKDMKSQVGNTGPTMVRKQGRGS